MYSTLASEALCTVTCLNLCSVNILLCILPICGARCTHATMLMIRDNTSTQFSSKAQAMHAYAIEISLNNLQLFVDLVSYVYGITLWHHC